jgi:hypothetical protein
MMLQPLPETFVATREALHRVAEQVVAVARKPQNEIALTQTPGGFGTPPFDYEGRSLQVMVDGFELVVREEDEERRTPLTTIADAAAFVGPDLFPDGVPDDSAPLEIDRVAAERLGELYALAADALARFRTEVSDADPSAINLWPEHFDLAFDAGDESAGERAGYGVSPGDEGHEHPYAYVGPWNQELPGDPGWNASGFRGAELGYDELASADDPVEALLGLFRSRREALTGP